MANVDAEKFYTVEEAVELLPKLSTSKFVGMAELHIKLNVDPKQADQNIRGTVSLPHGTGKSVRVAVISSMNPKEFTDLGAVKAGGEDLITAIEKGFMDFDVLVAESAMMPKIAKLAKVLGPKGLMPSPKSGTVSEDPVKALKEVMGGRVEFRVDQFGIAHCIFGKVDFAATKLVENFNKLFEAIKAAKPNSVKGKYIETLSLSPTMGPGVRVVVAGEASSNE